MAHYLGYFIVGFVGGLAFHKLIADGLNLSFWYAVAFIGLNFVTLVRLSYLTQPNWPFPADPIIDFNRPGWTVPADAISALTTELVVAFFLGATMAFLGALSGGSLRLVLRLGTSAPTFWRGPPTSGRGA